MNATRPIASQTDAATVARLQAQRQEMNANDSGKLAPRDVASWLTLQRLTLTQRGVCSEPEMFYRTEGNVLVSETIGRVMLDPGATIKFNTAFNLFPESPASTGKQDAVAPALTPEQLAFAELTKGVHW